MKIHIHTFRTYLRDVLPKDAQNFFDLDSDPEVHRYLGNNPITELKQCEEVIGYLREQYEKNGIGRWAVIHKESGEFMGWCGLKYETQLRTNTQYYDLGYRFKKKFWGQGYGTETAKACLEYGFSEMKLERISAAVDVDNVASNKILQKLGMQHVEDFYYDDTLCHFYTLEHKDWASQR